MIRVGIGLFLSLACSCHAPATVQPAPLNSLNSAGQAAPVDKAAIAAWLTIPHSQDSELVMIGAETCATTSAFRPHFEKLSLPDGVGRSYIDLGALGQAAEQLPVPFFAVIVNDELQDLHAGVVHPRNNFAEAANAQIFDHLMVRSGLAPGDRWASTMMNDGSEVRLADHVATSFARLDGQTVTADLNHAFVSHVSLRGADLRGSTFDHTIFAHADLTDARLPAGLTPVNLLLLNSICPDGLPSSEFACRLLGE